MFRVGQRVVCVNAKPETWHTTGLVKGEIYTIESMFKNCYGNLAFQMIEAKNGHGVGYRASRFRPIQERKTDISIFKAMLNPKKHELVDALPSRRQEGV